MKYIGASLTSFAVLIFIVACSSGDGSHTGDERATPTQRAVVYLKDAEHVSVEQAQLTTASELLSSGLHAQGTLYTHTLEAQDFHGAPFVHLTFTAPRSIGDLWDFAAELSGDEWDLHTSKWSVVTTGATRARADVSVVEKGLNTLLDLYETRRAVGASNVARLVAPLSGIIWIEDTHGRYWDITTRARVDRAVEESVKETYDDILSAGPDALASETVSTERIAMQNFNAVKGEAVDLNALGGLATQAYAYRGSWSLPDKPSSLLKTGGYAQDPTFYLRNSSHKWKMKGCIFGNNVSTSSLGCGPAAFAALLDYHFSHVRMKINWCEKRYTLYGRTYGCWDFRDFAEFLTESVGSSGKPRLVSYMGTCWFNGALTTPGGFTKGAETFLRKHVTRRKLNYAHSVGFSNPGHVANKLKVLRTALARQSPSIVLYPIGGKVSHYSLVKSWKAKTKDYGLFITPYNHPSISVNMGDSFSGYVGVWSIVVGKQN